MALNIDQHGVDMTPEQKALHRTVAGKKQHIEAPDPHRNMPQPDPACLYGLIGDIAKAGSEATEANPYAIALNAMAYLSCAVGRGPYMPIGDTWHHPRLFGLHIGRSGVARKGDAVSLMRRIEHRVGEIDQYLAPQIHSGGLSSREGLVHLIHDGYKDGKNEVPAIEDKRLLVVESEFVNVLHQGKRDGNTLSAALRDCWDGLSLKPATKSARLWATDPHVCLSAAITPSELIASVAARDLSNGFMNRFLPIWAERLQTHPFPKTATAAEVDALAQRVCAVLRFCGAQRWVERDVLLMSLSDAAMKRWEAIYRGELNDRSHGERINALIERRAPMLLRIAMLLALTDCQVIVEEVHLSTALAWIRYSVDSVKFVFSSGVDEAEAAVTNEIAAKIMAFVRERERVTRTQLTAECFAGHVGKDKLDAALDELLAANPPQIVVTEDRSGGGRPAKFYQLPANYAHKANNELRRGFAGDSAPGEQGVKSELSATLCSQSRMVRSYQELQQTGSSIDSSRNSLSSHANVSQAGTGIADDDGEVSV